MSQKTVFQTLTQFIVLFAFWLVLSGYYDFFHISIGFVCVVVVMLFNRKFQMHQFFSNNPTHRMTMRVFYYFPWLFWQLILAALQVAYYVVHPRLIIQPQLLKFKSYLPNISANVLLANSITITPGTLTIDVSPETREFVVHALINESASSLEDGSMQTEVAKLYSKKPGRVFSDFRFLGEDA